MRTKRRFSKADIARMERGQLPEPTEDEVQAVIVDGLKALGYLVLVTTRRARRCPKCKTYSHAGDGASKGIADLLVRRMYWPAGVWLALEVKKPGTVKWSSEEQRQAWMTGEIIVIQSLEDAITAAASFDMEWK